MTEDMWFVDINMKYCRIKLLGREFALWIIYEFSVNNQWNIIYEFACKTF